MSTSGLLTKLRDTNENLTLFAPTNTALNQLGSSMLTRMRNGDPCLQSKVKMGHKIITCSLILYFYNVLEWIVAGIMRNHLLPMTLCSSIIFQKGQVRNLDGVPLNVERTADDKLFVNGIQIITRDIITTNGILHVLDGVLISEDGKVKARYRRPFLWTFKLCLSYQ